MQGNGAIHLCKVRAAADRVATDHRGTAGRTGFRRRAVALGDTFCLMYQLKSYQSRPLMYGPHSSAWIFSAKLPWGGRR
jgi:hypothetical protein